MLDTAATAAGVDLIDIVSGGQPPASESTRRVGSTRHDHGRAADIRLFVKGVVQSFTDDSASPVVLAFVTAAARAGATGIGAGLAYMGGRTIHVGFGVSPTDRSELVWGASDRSANAPGWLRAAAAAGWKGASTAPAFTPPNRYEVIARSGLQLRGGPGIGFPPLKTLPLGQELTVVAHDPVDPAWLHVDLEGDGRLDGYVFGSFLAPATPSHDESAEREPE